MVGDLLQTLIFFGFIAAIVLGSQSFEARKRARVHETIELAMRQGQPVPPELIDLVARQTERSQPPSDHRWGLFVLFVGIGIAIFGQVMGAVSADARTALTGLAAIPFCIGIAGILLHFLGRRSS